MPQRLPLETIPSQEFPILLDGLRYTLQIRQTAPGVVLASVSIGDNQGVDTSVVQNVRVGHRTPFIPYPHLEQNGGNFWFETPNAELPDYTEFGARHQLLYASAAELAEARADA